MPRLSHRLYPAVAVALAAALLSACISTPAGYPAREWSKTLREMQVVPVFPPREGVQPGDIYFISTEQSGDAGASERQAGRGYLPIGMWVGRLDLRDAMRDQYAAELSFERTSTSTTVDDANGQSAGYVPQPTKPDQFGATPPTTPPSPTGDTDRPRIVAFPEFMSATFSKGDLSALIPVEALNVAAAAGFTKSRRVTLRIPMAESFGVPSTVALSALVGQGTFLKASDGFDPGQLKLLLTKPGSEKWSEGETVGYLRLITEVYMTRVVDIGVHDAKSRGARASVSPAGTPAPGGPAPAQPDAAQEGQDAAELAKALNAQLEAEMSGLVVPGGKIGFVSAGTSAVSMRRVFERPVVIGYRAILLKINARTAAGGTIQPYVAAASVNQSWVATGGDIEADKKKDKKKGKKKGKTPPPSSPESPIDLNAPQPPPNP